MNPFAIIQRHYDPGSELYGLLVTHSTLVAAKARALGAEYMRRHPEARVDLEFIVEAAMLHDLGIGRCHSPEILCRGSEPYIRHGVIGREILEAEGLPRHALVCERHTGSGITLDEVRRRELPLPARDYLPLEIEEKAICLADKFFSKKPGRLFLEKSPREVERHLAKWGPQVVARWRALCDLLLPPEHGAGRPGEGPAPAHGGEGVS